MWGFYVFLRVVEYWADKIATPIRRRRAERGRPLIPYPQLPAATRNETRNAFLISAAILAPVLIVIGTVMHAHQVEKNTPPPTVDVSHIQLTGLPLTPRR